MAASAEDAAGAAGSARGKRGVPVTVLTGFLGSGKTTLLNHILDNKRGLRVAVIENEFGDVGVDDTLIKRRDMISTEDEIVEMMNGCICCTVRKDLQVVLKRLLHDDKRPLDAIIIETTGLADPAPVAQTFFVDELLRRLCYLDAIITVVDAKHIVEQLTRERPADVENEAEEQLAFADRIIINKLDLVPDRAELDKVIATVRTYNPTAEIIETTRSVVPPEKLMGLEAFSLERVLVAEPTFLEDTEHKHDTSVTSVCVVSQKPMSVGLLERWIGDLLREHGASLFRYKGVINVMGMHERFVFQGVQMMFQGSFTTPWAEDEVRCSKFVFIGRNLPKERLLAEFAKCEATRLRFRVGTRVMAQVGTWQRGKVIAQWDEGNAYRVRLDNGKQVWAPIDDDSVVRRA